MFADNPFWVLVSELYPLFLKVCLLAGIWRMSKGVYSRLQGNAEGIGKAINDIIVAFFFAHMTLPLVGLIWKLMQDAGDSATTVFNQMF